MKRNVTNHTLEIESAPFGTVNTVNLSLLFFSEREVSIYTVNNLGWPEQLCDCSRTFAGHLQFWHLFPAEGPRCKGCPMSR